MLLFIYNILQLVILALFWPLLLLGIAAKKKYRGRFGPRLGLGLTKQLPTPSPNCLTFWIHALSVGEVTSAAPLISGIRARWPDCRIIVTATTTTGLKTAAALLQDKADYILSPPIDIRPVIARFIQRIDPDIYIQVETDFWPNQLQMLRSKEIPAILVNGRISEKSFASYRKFSIFFKPMFLSFRHLCMQTEKDRSFMAELGVPENSLHTLGNLKFDAKLSSKSGAVDYTAFLPENAAVITAGSTHPGEEEILLDVFARIRLRFNDVYPVIVPRNPDRGQSIKTAAENRGFHPILRSQFQEEHGNLLIVDTIGELIHFYRCSHVAFVGGSLVPEGGHNPIEPALFSIPVLFGQHMDDFNEISADLEKCGGGESAADADQLELILCRLLEQPQAREQMGAAASSCVESRQGVIQKHLDLLDTLL